MAKKRTTYIGGCGDICGGVPPVIQINLGPGVQSINGMTGDVVLTPEDIGAASAEDLSFVFEQAQPAAVWEIVHNLGRFPSVTTENASGEPMVGVVGYLDLNSLRITFSQPVAGKAYLN